MKFAIAVVVLATLAAAAVNAEAQGWSIKIVGSTDNGVTGAGTNGACNGGAGLANVCSSGGPGCTCFTTTGTVSGSAGKGTFTFYESFDNGFQVIGKSGNANCAPFYGEIDVSGSKDNETIGVRGS